MSKLAKITLTFFILSIKIHLVSNQFQNTPPPFDQIPMQPLILGDNFNLSTQAKNQNVPIPQPDKPVEIPQR